MSLCSIKLKNQNKFLSKLYAGNPDRVRFNDKRFALVFEANTAAWICGILNDLYRSVEQGDDMFELFERD